MRNRFDRQAMLMAPLLAPVGWAAVRIVQFASSQHLGWSAIFWQLLCLISTIVVSYALTTPFLLLLSRFERAKERDIRWRLTAILAVISFLIGFALSLPEIADASRLLQAAIAATACVTVNCTFFLLLASREKENGSDSAEADRRAAFGSTPLEASSLHQFGIISTLCGSLALLLAVIATFAEATYGTVHAKTWFVLEWFAKADLFKNPAAGASELVPASAFDLSEANAILWTYAGAITLASYSMLAMLAAEWRREDSLYQSVGILCAGMAIVLINPMAGIALLMAFYAAGMSVRHAMRKQTSP